MEGFVDVALAIYAGLAVTVVTFVAWILQSMITSAWECSSSVRVQFSNNLHTFILQFREDHDFLRQRNGRHTKDEWGTFLKTAVQHMRDINDGRRTVVTARG